MKLNYDVDGLKAQRTHRKQVKNNVYNTKDNNTNRMYVRGTLPREVAQAVEVPTTLEATELGRVM